MATLKLGSRPLKFLYLLPLSVYSVTFPNFFCRVCTPLHVAAEVSPWSLRGGLTCGQNAPKTTRAASPPGLAPAGCDSCWRRLVLEQCRGERVGPPRVPLGTCTPSHTCVPLDFQRPAGTRPPPLAAVRPFVSAALMVDTLLVWGHFAVGERGAG